MTRQPQITPSEIEVQQATRTVLPNGVALYTLPADEFEVLRISFVFRAGSSVQQVPFSASAAANLLAEGSEAMTAAEIAEQLDYHGSWYDVNIDRDYAYINFATLSKFFAETLAVAEELLLRPTFPEEELRQAAKSAVCKINIDSDSRLAMTAAIREVFATKPAEFDPRKYLGPARDNMKKLYIHKIKEVLGSDGKAE